MPYIVTETCIDVKDKSCISACPADCIYEGGRTVYIHPTECIDCGLCETICPVAAIYADDRLPEDKAAWVAINSEYFGPSVTGLGSPGGADNRADARDHPVVAGWQKGSAPA